LEITNQKGLILERHITATTVVNMSKSANNWTNVQNKSRFPHHNSGESNNDNTKTSYGNGNGYGYKKNYGKNAYKKSKNSKDFLIEVIKGNTKNNIQDWEKIRDQIYEEFSTCKNEKENSMMMNNIVKFSLHEVLRDPRIITIMNSLHKVGQHAPIHIALWRNKDIEKSFKRTDEDAFETVKVIMENSNFSVLDKNDKEETVLNSLAESRRCGFLGEETASKIYDYLMEPNEKTIANMTKEVFNKITSTNLDTFRPTICWLISLPLSKFGDEIFEKLQFVKPMDRDSVTHKYREIIKISSLFSIISKRGPGKSDYDGYFEKNSWSPKHIDKIRVNIIDRFVNCDLDKAHNIEIIGGVVGEFSGEQEIINYCQSYKAAHPEIVTICIAHAYPRFKNKMMLDILSEIQKHTRGKVLFTIKSIIELYQPEIAKNQKQIASVKKQEDEEELSNPLIGRLALRQLNKLPDEEMRIAGEDLYPEELDNAAYSVCDYLSKTKKEVLCEAIIVELLESVNTEIGLKAIDVLIKYLIEIKGLDKKIFSTIFKTKIGKITELYADENPAGFKKVRTKLENLFKL